MHWRACFFFFLVSWGTGLACAAEGPWERSCPDGEGCAEDERCERSIGLPDYEATHSVCEQRCEEDEQCPPPGSGNALPTCNERGLCELGCGSEVVCPTGMVCADSRCKWPH